MYSFIVMGLSWFLVDDNAEVDEKRQKEYSYCTAFCMLTGVGIGMFAYASIKKEYITNK